MNPPEISGGPQDEAPPSPYTFLNQHFFTGVCSDFRRESLLNVPDHTLNQVHSAIAAAYPKSYSPHTIRDRRRVRPRLRGSSKQRPRRGEAYVHRERVSRARKTHAGLGVSALLARSHPLAAPTGQLAFDLPALSHVPARAPQWIERLALAVGADAYAAVPLWSGAQRWARVEVAVAYDLRYKMIRHLMPNNGVSRANVIKVADARAYFAEGRTGRHCRPSNATLARCSGLDKRIVQRASLALRLMGCATEILRGRQRTKRERLASWKMGDRSRGWASVWALHTPLPLVDNSRNESGLWAPLSGHLSPHPRRGSVLLGKQSFSSLTPTENDPQDRAGHGPPNKGGAPRHSTDTRRVKPGRFRPVDERGRFLALRWRAEGRTPAWVRNHSNQGWAAVLAKPAAHGWTPEDLNAVIHEWVTVGGNFLPTSPHKPIGLLYTILKWHGDLSNRPAADAAAQAAAQHAAELADMRARRAAADAARPASAAQRQAARAMFQDSQRHRK